MKSLGITPLVFSLALSQNMTEIQYLKKVFRLDDTGLVDYFFSCRGVGRSLGWDVNGVLIGFVGFKTHGFFGTGAGTGVISFATLFPTTPAGNNTFNYFSLLVVTSTVRNTTPALTVHCSVGTMAVTTTNSVEPALTNPIVTEVTDNAYLQFLFAVNVTDGATTYVYSCGVNDTKQGWAAGISFSLKLDSSITNRRGNEMVSDNTLAELRTFTISKEPYPLSSIFYMTGLKVVDVRCNRRTSTPAVLTVSRVLASLAFRDQIMMTPTPAIYYTTLTDITTKEVVSEVVSEVISEVTTPPLLKPNTGMKSSSVVTNVNIIVVAGGIILLYLYNRV